MSVAPSGQGCPIRIADKGLVRVETKVVPSPPAAFAPVPFRAPVPLPACG
ncbi:MAG: hypothetical protein ACKOZT_01820 [Cyanobium sp.]